jgi:hypothetical protein
MTERVVGPVLSSNRIGQAVAAALTQLNPGLVVEHRGGYLRVSAPVRCRLTRSAVEEELGEPFRLASDLERVMPSFRGQLVLGDEEARWE